ncbi:transglycosylase SLT domain-containing protein [Helicobacter baculiformis]|uniref:Transglycosylase SLT domain-containing protein n=1 Tax=Helicobacter baculiformis TaxID=427351 RepID=A0ABV7ZFY4_9HELI|nr:lytic transglycosylase domain-containing protein [Helicobacter baculiformis]
MARVLKIVTTLLMGYALAHAQPINTALNLKPLNGFGVDAEFLANVDNSQTLQSVREAWDKFVQHYDSNGVFIPTIKSMLAQADIPTEFLFLAMAESNFSTRAYSVKKAVGIWQLMPDTARMLGLEVNAYIDERRDPIKSTKAAIKYLRILYKKTKQWYLVAMAYNYGPRRVLEAIQEAGSDDINILLDDERRFIPRETRGYIRSILSLAIAFNNLDALKHKEYLLNRGARTSLASLKIQGGTLLSHVAQGARLSLAQLKSYNHQFHYNFLPPGKTYMVYIPYENLAHFKQNYKPSHPLSALIIHKVRPRETLYSIARKFHTSVGLIKTTNDLKGTRLSRNQKLVIPILSKQDPYKGSKKVAQNEY